jgi:glucosamine--fructose-6-phosphate aminotransferase (isomerizing)
MEKEIMESPKVAQKLVNTQWANILKAAEAIRVYKPRFVVLVARGTSDNACTYARYLIEKEWKVPVSLAAPGVTTLYGSKIDYRGGLVIGVSQSGQGPDVCDVVQTARSQSALTVGLTNNMKSRLAHEAKYTIDLSCGPEKSVAATKTYTSELVALYGLIMAVNNGAKVKNELKALPKLIAQGCKLSEAIWKYSNRFHYLSSCVVIGRGFHYGLAQESALKLKECAQVMAHAYSTADFHHGPKTLAGKDFPVILIAPTGATLKGSLALLKELNERGAFVIAFSSVPQVLKKASVAIRIPSGSEVINPIGIAPMIQTLALAVAMVKGLNPDQPPYLKKVTQTK